MNGMQTAPKHTDTYGSTDSHTDVQVTSQHTHAHTHNVYRFNRSSLSELSMPSSSKPSVPSSPDASVLSSSDVSVLPSFNVSMASSSKPDFVHDSCVVGCASLAARQFYISLELRAKPCKNRCCCVLVLLIYGLLAFSSHGFILVQC